MRGVSFSESCDHNHVVGNLPEDRRRALGSPVICGYLHSAGWTRLFAVQRAQKKLDNDAHTTQITKGRIKRLNNIGFDWKPPRCGAARRYCIRFRTGKELGRECILVKSTACSNVWNKHPPRLIERTYQRLNVSRWSTRKALRRWRYSAAASRSPRGHPARRQTPCCRQQPRRPDHVADPCAGR